MSRDESAQGHYHWFARRMVEGLWWLPLAIFAVVGAAYYFAGYGTTAQVCLAGILGALLGRASGVNDFAE